MPAALVFAPGTLEFELHPDIECRRIDAWKGVLKQYGSSYAATDLAGRLRQPGIDAGTLVGFVTSNCILASAVEADLKPSRALIKERSWKLGNSRGRIPDPGITGCHGSTIGGTENPANTGLYPATYSPHGAFATLPLRRGNGSQPSNPTIYQGLNV